MKRFVTDTGPLLHLHEVGAWNLLPNLGAIETTPAVVSELKRFIPLPRKANWPKWLRVVRPSPIAKSAAQAWMHVGLLDQGEAEALAYAQETQAHGFLTDDAEAREMAAALQLEVRGSLGVVLLAAAHGQINQTEASAFLVRLEQASSLWLSAKVRQAAHDALMQIYRA